MKPGPRALYVEVKRRFNGKNNGALWLSHRDAAKAICVTKNTIGAYFSELEARGFIHKVQVGFLGPDGIGQATTWALDEEPTCDGKPATKGFVNWRKQKPVPISGSTRTRKRDTDGQIGTLRAPRVPKTGTENR
jgi:hypothetical protein